MMVVAAVVAGLIWRPTPQAGSVVQDTNSARPTGSQWDELDPTAQPSMPEDTGQGQTIECPQNSMDYRSSIDKDGRMRGGGLSFQAQEGWRNTAVYLPWLYDHNSQTRPITSQWMSNLSVGIVKRSEGFTSPRQTARSIMDCMSSSDLFHGLSGREDLVNESHRLDGRIGWRITANVFVDNQGPIKGDVVDIIVLDLGDPDTYSVFISCATIDLEENLAEVAESTASLRVE